MSISQLGHVACVADKNAVRVVKSKGKAPGLNVSFQEIEKWLC